jgi:DNA-directed RNA polymerase specialized sigma24 family protein
MPEPGPLRDDSRGNFPRVKDRHARGKRMTDSSPTISDLDGLLLRALEGAREAETALFEGLRARLLRVAKQRVREDDAPDVVQDALRIVLLKFRARGDQPGILPWSLTVLRNVIGNYYQKADHRKEWISLEHTPSEFLARAGEVAARETDPGDDRAQRLLVKRLAVAIRDLSDRHPRCGAIFRAILASLDAGGNPREISSRALETIQQEYSDLTRGLFYVALHRCRANLRQILAEAEKGAPAEVQP